MQKKNDFNNPELLQERERNRMEKIRQYVSNNLSKDLSPPIVADHFQMSMSSLDHLFKKHFGQTYWQYVKDIRITTAFDLIKKEGMRVQQAMYATGYKYKSSFNKCFKEKFKHPPSYFKQ